MGGGGPYKIFPIPIDARLFVAYLLTMSLVQCIAQHCSAKPLGLGTS